MRIFKNQLVTSIFHTNAKKVENRIQEITSTTLPAALPNQPYHTLLSRQLRWNQRWMSQRPTMRFIASQSGLHSAAPIRTACVAAIQCHQECIPPQRATTVSYPAVDQNHPRSRAPDIRDTSFRAPRLPRRKSTSKTLQFGNPSDEAKSACQRGLNGILGSGIRPLK